MFSTKKDVDRHVRTAFAKLSDNEKNNRSLTIAKLYFKIGEYASARQYIYNFLTVGNDKPEAHKLLGQCYEKLKLFDKAVAAYQQSLRLDAKQHDVLSNVCNLILSNDVNTDQIKIKDIIDMAESESIQNDAVLSLKLKLNKDKVDPSKLNEMIMKEIIARPTLPSLRIRLLKNFIEQSRVSEAFKYAYDVEMKNNDNFATSLNWYNMIAKVLGFYRSSPEKLCPKNREFWLMSILTIEKQIYLNLVAESRVQFSQDSNLKETTDLLFEFDQLLHLASSVFLNLCPEREFAVQFLSHYRGQWCLHASSILLMRDKATNKSQWKETLKYAMPLLLLAFQCGTADTHEGWLKHAGEVTRQLILLWNRQGAFRCSQAGRTILSCIADADILDIACSEKSFIFTSSDDLIEDTRKFCSSTSWRNSIYRNIFANNNLSKIDNSYFVNSKSLTEPAYEIPISSDLSKYEEIAQWLYPYSLSFMVYLGLGSNNLENFACSPFNQLNFSLPNLSNCSTGTLNQLDIESYLICSIIQAKRNLELEKKNYEIYNSCAFPMILPYGNIANKLCSDEQSEWWNGAYKISRNVVIEDFVKARMLLQHGIQAIRGVGTPYVSLYIVLELANILENRAKLYKKQNKIMQKDFIELRAVALYKHGLQIIKMQQRGTTPNGYNNYFKYADPQNELDTKLNSMAEKGIAFIAKKYFEKADYEECAEELSEIKLPYAAYYQAAAYNLLIKSNKGVLSKKIYADKAKDSLNRALEYLNNSNIEHNHPLRSVVTSDSVSNGFFHDNDVKEDNNTNDERFNEILIKMSDMEKLIRQMNTSINIVNDEVVELKKSDLYNIKCELLDVQVKLNDLINKKAPSLRDEDDQVLANLLDDEFQNQLAAANANQLNANFNNPAQMQQLTQNQMQYYMSQQTAAAANPYGASLYNSPYPMYLHHPFMNYPQSVQTMSGTTLKQPAHLMEIQKPITELSPHQLNDSRLLLPETHPSMFPGTFQHHQQPQQQQQQHQHQQPKNIYDQSTDQRLPQNSISEMISTSSVYKSLYPYNNAPVEKAAPINVVITNSDPLPTHTQVTTQPPLSVTIPPQHIKNSSNIYNPNEINPIYDQPPPSIPSIITSAVVQSSQFQQNQTIVSEPPPPQIQQHQQKNSAPKFESENELFSGQAKFFKSIVKDKDTKEWKEQADGQVKLLKNKSSKAARIVVVQDKTNAIVLDFAINESTKFQTTNKPNLKMAHWSGPDPAKIGSIVKYCARFNDSNTAKKFLEESEKLKPTPAVGIPTEISSPSIPASVGGFLIKNPQLKDIQQEKPKEIETTPPKSNLFANFSFSKTDEASTPKPFASIFSPSTIGQPIKTPFSTIVAQSSPASDPNKSGGGGADGDDDYVPTAQFQPVVTLSEIEVKTGEEDEIIAYEERVKLLRFDPLIREWKERGVGNMKILVHKTDCNKLRLLMRREQVLKLCCNQLVTKETKFNYLPNSKVGITWYGPDYSENELKTEVLAMKFKTEAACAEFLKVIAEYQKKMSDGGGEVETDGASSVSAKEEPKANEKGFGDQFKLKPGAWNCSACYVSNKADVLYCVSCESPKDSSVPKKEPKSVLSMPSGTSSKFSFGMPPSASPATLSSTQSIAQPLADPPKYTFGMQQNTKPSFTPVTTKEDNKSTDKIGFGNQFKPQAGSWTCDACYVSNKGDSLYCLSCESPKDSTVPKKDPKPLLGMPLITSSKFTFGVPPPSTTSTAPPTQSFFTPPPKTTTQSTTNYSLGASMDTSTINTATAVTTSTTHNANNGNDSSTNSFTQPFSTTVSSGFSFNNTSQSQDSTLTTNSSNDGPISSKTSGFTFEPKESFNFVMKPKSPGKMKSPHKDGQDDDDDGVAEEEENNTYFTPVIPLPEKIDVKTGEEDEEVLYTHRAKLYRFVDNEWKERGLGDIKILRHYESRKLRVVMRREQVLKLCLNHFLTPEIDYRKKDDKSFHFAVNDFSEEKLEALNLCVRFKTAEIATEFKNAIDRVLQKEKEENWDNVSQQLKENDGNESKPIEILEAKVSENNDTNITSEEKKLIEDLMLPNNFYNFKKENDCQGCRGCKSDDFVFPTVDANVNKDIISESLALPTEFKALDLSTITPEKSTQSLNNLGSIEKEKPVANTIFGGKGNIFGGQGFVGQNVFNGASQISTINNTSGSLFGPSSFLTPTKDTASKENENVSEEENEKAEKTIFGGGSVGSGFKFGESQPLFGSALKLTTKPTENLNAPLFGSKLSSSFSFAEAAKDLEHKSDVIEPPKLTFGVVQPPSTNTTTKTLFGFNTTSTESDKQSSQSFLSEENKQETNERIFGNSKPLFGSFNTASTVDANKKPESFFPTSVNTPSFGNLSKANIITEASVDLSKDILKTDPGLSFASLASASAQSNAFQNTNAPAGGGFYGISNQQDFSHFFKNAGTPNNNDSASRDDSNANDTSTGTEETAYDPHYEPIIALPDEIVVTTGEENEEKLFGERAKLFRYDADTNEWKERGVGELKLLHHPVNGTYRLIMRREQIHKLVLNHSISSKFVYNPMNTSGNSYCWATLNYPEEFPQGATEKLAARFKYAEIAERFNTIVKRTVEQLKSRSDLEPEDD